MFNRLIKFPTDKSFFLFGPRGTGKSYWLRKHYKDNVYIDLLDSETFFRLSSAPEKLDSFIPDGYSKGVIIDEVQKVPQILNEVHRLIEIKGYKFILTGSSARKLKKQDINLLAGRALTFYMHPLCYEELSEGFDLRYSLEYGHMPSVYIDSDPEGFLKSYVVTYLKEEVFQEGLTRNLGNFSRFFETASFSQGSVLNISEVARECSLNRKLVESYFTILEDLLLSIRLPVFTKKAKRRMTQHPKFYFFDAGIYRAIRPKGPLDSPEEIQGVSLETLFLQELRAVNDNYKLAYDIYYWRTSNQIEVDFVLYGKKGLFAFEIKRKGKYSSKDLAGLRKFLEDFPVARGFLIYGGTKRFYENNIEIIPVNEAIARLPEILDP
ncbi:MAG: ATP-binding protein [Deltaproteobacteria bacterium]|nr:ATP-binding protein [Deltaproteobacteria bacterium]